jgi:hypothetical protein
MKYLFVAFLAMSFNLISYAQSTNSSQNFKVETNQEAGYPGGETELYKDIYIKLKYSEVAIEQKIETTVMLSLFVETDSTVSRVSILNDPGFGVADSLTSYLSNTKFVPALMNGKPFRTQIMLNIPVRAH